MPLSRPNYIPSPPAGYGVAWPWDDWNVEQSYKPGDAELMERLAPLSRRARIAMTVAIAEWTVFQLKAADEDPTPRQYLEAAWAGTVHHAWCPYIEFADRDWSGPVRGPLHVTMALINDALHFEGADLEQNAGWASQLAQLVLPSSEPFTSWKEGVLQRLERWYPSVPVAEDDFAYDWELAEPLIPRECFDPGTPFDPSLSRTFVHQYLKGVDYVGNPFISTPADLRAAGVVTLAD